MKNKLLDETLYNVGVKFSSHDDADHFRESTKLKERSTNCWDDWYRKLMELASRDNDAEAMIASIENLDEIHDKIGSFKNADESDIEQINLALDCLAGASDYELYDAVEEMRDYFGFNELDENTNNAALFEGVLKESTDNSSKKLKEATDDSPEKLLYELYDASFDSSIHWDVDDLYSDFEQYFKKTVHSWEDFITESKDDVNNVYLTCNEFLSMSSLSEKIKDLSKKIVDCIDRARNSSTSSDNNTDPQTIITNIKEHDFNNFVSAYLMGKTIYVDFDTEDKSEVQDIADTIEDEIVNSEDWCVNVGTVADFSEDDYNDLDEDLRDTCQIIIYRRRR